MGRKAINVSTAPAPKSLYAHAVQVTAGSSLLFLSGQVGRDTEGHVPPGDIQAQTRQALENIKAILGSVGADMSNVVKVMFLVRDMAHWAAINQVRAEYFTGELPASTFMEVNRFVDPSWMIEIDCIAVVD